MTVRNDVRNLKNRTERLGYLDKEQSSSGNRAIKEEGGLEFSPVRQTVGRSSENKNPNGRRRGSRFLRRRYTIYCI